MSVETDKKIAEQFTAGDLLESLGGNPVKRTPDQQRMLLPLGELLEMDELVLDKLVADFAPRGANNLNSQPEPTTQALSINPTD